MTDIEKKALALVNEVRAEYGYAAPVTYDWFNADSYEHLAFLRAIEQHEAFKREVSDAVEKALYQMRANQLMQAQVAPTLTHFIIPKPDPLVEVMNEWWDADGYASIETFRAALAARGLEVRKIGEGE